MHLDLFAGAGGWSTAASRLGTRLVGLELDTAACDTRSAAGHATISTDITTFPTGPLAPGVIGMTASPPCQSWSAAGKRLGLIDQPLVHRAVADLAAGHDTRSELRTRCADPRSLLAAEPMRFLAALNEHHLPQWLLMEAVPAVLPLWHQYAHVLRGWGFSTWHGLLNAADFGVPQTRVRATLIATRTGVASPPEPTHARNGEPDTLWGPARRRWVSMAEALGWGATDRPAPTLCAGGPPTGGPEPFPTGSRRALAAARDRGTWKSPFASEEGAREPKSSNQANAAVRQLTEPVGTLFFGHRADEYTWIRQPATHGAVPPDIKITPAEAGILQTFSDDYPWQGTKSQQVNQIGNAIPPLFAEHLLAPHLVRTRDDYGLAA
ncbi:DNA cytosine methyltransferase [Streptomyces carpaticus]|uniref:DNA cytosine methyltransferase n=1 Tax=Streptomyces carpaticus TaxID=285558 RepID=UPI0031F9FBF9